MSWISVVFILAGTALIIAGMWVLLAAARPAGTPDTRRARQLILKLVEMIKRPRRVERFIYRHHRWFGGAIVAGGLMLLWLFGTYSGRMVETSAWSSWLSVRLALMAVWALVVFALLIGVCISIRPSALKKFEAVANHWIEPFHTAVPGTEPMKPKFLRTLFGTPERTGMLLVLAGIACFLAAAKMAST